MAERMSRRQDGETEAILYEGASISQLGRLFDMDNRDIKAKLHGLAPVGVRAGSPVYRVKDAAERLVAPVITDIDEFIRRMSVADLPLMLRKEFWAGMRSRQLYEQEDGKLWPEEKVEEVIVEQFKTLKMSMLLIRDSVSRESELSDRQQHIIERLIDNALGELHAAVVRRFSNANVSELPAEGGSELRAPEPVEDEEL